MDKRLKRKIKNRIWLFSLVLLLCSILAVINSPIVWVKLLPIIIPTFGLTVGVPAYSIFRYVKDGTKKLEVQAQISNEYLDEHLKEKSQNVSINNSSKNYDITYEGCETTQEKNKVKTKGTIH